jgi:hypothetical protein
VNKAIKYVVVYGSFFLGVLFAFGSLLAARFAIDGFGTLPIEPLGLYLSLLALGFIACLTVPFILYHFLIGKLDLKIWFMVVVFTILITALLGFSL